MGIAYIEQIRGYPYMSIQKLAEEFHCSTRTVSRRIEGILEEIKNGRYNKYSILDSAKIPLVNVYVYIDYEKYWKFLSDSNGRKSVPEFNPKEIAYICGFNQKIVFDEERGDKNAV